MPPTMSIATQSLRPSTSIDLRPSLGVQLSRMNLSETGQHAESHITLEVGPPKEADNLRRNYFWGLIRSARSFVKESNDVFQTRTRNDIQLSLGVFVV